MSNPIADPSSVDDTAPLVVRTRRIDDPGDLLTLLPPDGALAWVHGGDGLVGWGRAATFTARGPERFAAADTWWRTQVARSVSRDDVGRPGSGLVAFGSFAFADEGEGTTLVVPEIVVGRRDGISWITTIGTTFSTPPTLTPREELGVGPDVAFEDDETRRARWRDTVATAVARIAAGDLDKVVLARSVDAVSDQVIDVRRPLRRLAAQYPSCWTFHIDGFFGSTPEMLVRLEGGLVTSRVLAGTIRRSGDDQRDLALAASLAHSSKDLEEHEYAVASVAEALAPHCTGMNVPEAPFVLHLPNVMHLATDVTGVLRDDASALSLAAALHPSAAVGGTPRPAAVALIAKIEDLDRARYAGPVGWIGADGDGEWGIGLRSAQLLDGGRRVRLFAGCGIVAESVPADELAESDAKLVPVRTSLTAD